MPPTCSFRTLCLPHLLPTCNASPSLPLSSLSLSMQCAGAGGSMVGSSRGPSGGAPTLEWRPQLRRATQEVPRDNSVPGAVARRPRRGDNSKGQASGRSGAVRALGRPGVAASTKAVPCGGGTTVQGERAPRPRARLCNSGCRPSAPPTRLCASAGERSPSYLSSVAPGTTFACAPTLLLSAARLSSPGGLCSRPGDLTHAVALRPLGHQRRCCNAAAC